MAPPFDFISRSFLPCLRLMGAEVGMTLDQAGFYPAGGGRCQVRIQPTGKLTPLHIGPETGRLQHSARILISGLPRQIAGREAAVLAGSVWDRAEIDHYPSRGPGNLVMLESQGEQICSLHVAFGEKRLPAEQVAQTALVVAKRHLASKLPVEEHLADQLLLPMALAGSGSYYTSELSGHTRTNIATIQQFLTHLPVECMPYGKGWKVVVGQA